MVNKQLIAEKIEWRIEPGLADYAQTVSAMEHRAEAIARGEAPELIWLVEHPPVFTAGTSAKTSDLLAPGAIPVIKAGRGGQYTYHGPGQRVVYVLLDLSRRGKDLKCFVHGLEAWIIQALSPFAVAGERRAGRVGVWVSLPDHQEAKIAAIGVRVRRWVSFHGFAINVAPDLSHYAGIVPCGIRAHGVTSLQALGREASMEALDAALLESVDALLDRLKPPTAAACAAASAPH